METLQKILLIFTIVGAINWGLVGLVNVDLVALLFGAGSMLTKVVYTIVAICGLVNIGILLGHIEYRKD